MAHFQTPEPIGWAVKPSRFFLLQTATLIVFGTCFITLYICGVHASLSYNRPSLAHIRSSGETSGPDIMALITAFPSSDFPVSVALNASTAWPKGNLFYCG